VNVPVDLLPIELWPHCTAPVGCNRKCNPTSESWVRRKLCSKHNPQPTPRRGDKANATLRRGGER
jgi:hypothetical protein